MSSEKTQKLRIASQVVRCAIRRLELPGCQLARQHLMKNDTERINIRSVIHLLWLLDLRRGDGMRCACDLLVIGQICPPALASNHFGNAEVGNFHAPWFVE